MQPRVNIVILNWNGYDYTSDLLESLKNITYQNYKIIVVDNNSSQNDVGRLISKYGDTIQLVCEKENLGFTGGNNVGINISLKQNADFVLLINNDTIVESDFLNNMLLKYDASNNIGIVAPMIYYFDNPDRLWSSGGKISKIRGSGFIPSSLSGSKIDRYNRQVEFVSGCCMLIKKEVFEKVGLLDDNFFLYIEDTDFCYRTINAGYDIYVSSVAKIYHKVNGSTTKNYSTLPLYYSVRNRLFFARKNFPEVYPFTMAYIIFSLFLKSIFWLLSGRRNNITAIQNAIKDFFSQNMGKAKYY